jgi:hypothetical protein
VIECIGCVQLVLRTGASPSVNSGFVGMKLDVFVGFFEFKFFRFVCDFQVSFFPSKRDNNPLDGKLTLVDVALLTAWKMVLNPVTFTSVLLLPRHR